MNQFRVLMTTAALLATAAAANGQTSSPFTPQTIREAAQLQVQYYQQTPRYTPPLPNHPVPHDLDLLHAITQQAQTGECPHACDANWYVRTLQQGVAAWKRVCSMCTPSDESCCQPACAAAAQVKVGACKGAECCCTAGAGYAKGFHVQVTPTTAGTFMLGVAANPGAGQCGAAKCCEMQAGQPPCCGIKVFTQLACPLGFTASTPACCCAKACACCEMCKAKAVVALPPLPQVAPQPMVYQVAPPASVTQVWSTPMPPPAGARVVVGMPTSGPATKPAHLVTPDLEAHCQRITHRDGLVILEGNVVLLCKKHAQPIRIEAPRVVVNMKDGSFTVDSQTAPTSATSFGVMRTTNVVMPAPTMPAQAIPVSPYTFERRVIEIVPVLPAPSQPR